MRKEVSARREGQRGGELTKTTPFVEQVSSTSAEIDDLRTAIAVFLQSRALRAVIRVRDPCTEGAEKGHACQKKKDR